MLLDANNQAVTSGLHAEDFENRIGKTHFVGRRLPPGEVWQAKGVSTFSPPFHRLSMRKEHLLKELVERAREAVGPYRAPEIGLPHPSWLFQLPDDVYTGSNLFAFQKSFDGPFKFDVFYESASAKQRLSCRFFLKTALVVTELSHSYNSRPRNFCSC